MQDQGLIRVGFPHPHNYPFPVTCMVFSLHQLSCYRNTSCVRAPYIVASFQLTSVSLFKASSGVTSRPFLCVLCRIVSCRFLLLLVPSPLQVAFFLLKVLNIEGEALCALGKFLY